MRHIYLLLMGLVFLRPDPFLFAQSHPLLSRDEKLQTVAGRFPPPEGYSRVETQNSSFASWLRRLPLLPEGSPVRDYNGKIRLAADDSSLAAVLAYDISGHRLEQCMDILIRLHSMWLQETGRDSAIVYPLPEGTLMSWQDWRQGVRFSMQGLRFRRIQATVADDSPASFEHYLTFLFDYSFSQTFYYHYPPISFDSLAPGDFIVKKGYNDSHAVLILDLAQDAAGKRVALFAQGDTPARQFHILKGKNSPWIPVSAATAPQLPIRKKMTWDGLRRFPQP